MNDNNCECNAGNIGIEKNLNEKNEILSIYTFILIRIESCVLLVINNSFSNL
jgi:hypothetical protein